MCGMCTKRKHLQMQKKIRIISCKKLLEFVAMDIPGPLPKNLHGNKYVLVILDHNLKLTEAIPVPKNSALHAANLFLDHWIIPLDILKYLLTDNGPRFVSKFLQSVGKQLEIKQLNTTSYFSQTNQQE